MKPDVDVEFLILVGLLCLMFFGVLMLAFEVVPVALAVIGGLLQ
jgi:hypothetical protein